MPLYKPLLPGLFVDLLSFPIWVGTQQFLNYHRKAIKVLAILAKKTLRDVTCLAECRTDRKFFKHEGWPWRRFPYWTIYFLGVSAVEIMMVCTDQINRARFTICVIICMLDVLDLFQITLKLCHIKDKLLQRPIAQTIHVFKQLGSDEARLKHKSSNILAFWLAHCSFPASFTCCLPSFLPYFLPSFLRFFVSSFLPSFLPSFLRFFIPSFLPSFLSFFLPFFLTSCLPSFLPFFLPFFLTSYLPSFVSSFPSPLLPAFLPSFLPFFLTFFLPFFLRFFLPFSLTSCLPSFLSSLLSSFLRFFLPSFLRSFLPSFLSSFLRFFLPFFLPSFLLRPPKQKCGDNAEKTSQNWRGKKSTPKWDPEDK